MTTIVIYVNLFLLFLTCSMTNAISSYHCEHKVGEELSKTKCIAGRRFFARLDKNPTFRKIFSEEVLVQSYTFPWIAQIISNYDGITNFCGGVLINDRYILTAQQCCLPPLKPQNFQVTLGYIYRKDNRTIPSCALQTNVLNIILHPNYYLNTEEHHNDIALLELHPITYSKTIYPIQLPSKLDKFKTLTNELVESAGYQKNSNCNKFEKIDMQIISDEGCSDYRPSYKSVIDADILCSNIMKDVKSAYPPPLGTPLMMEKRQGIYDVTILIGIATWNEPISEPHNKRPVLYVRIDKKLPWIMQNTENALYCNN